MKIPSNVLHRLVNELKQLPNAAFQAIGPWKPRFKHETVKLVFPTAAMANATLEWIQRNFKPNP